MCDECEMMDGVIIADMDEWDVEPGDMHVNCRCVEVYVEGEDANVNAVSLAGLEEGAAIYYEPERELPLYWLAGAVLLGGAGEPDHAPEEIEDDYWLFE